MLTDMPQDELEQYTGSSSEPPDFDEFWRRTLAGAREQSSGVAVREIPHPFEGVTVADVAFSGWNGENVKAWLVAPTQASSTGGLPGIVRYQGYGGGRGDPFDGLAWAAAGYALLTMDTRGQGSGWSVGATPDSGIMPPQYPGVMTRGILDPETYYYRRLITDAVRAFEALRSLDGVDGTRCGVMGASQGGGLSLAVAALAPGVKAVAAGVPFLCDYERAVRIATSLPYTEVANYLSVHRTHVDQVFRTLSYFDGVNFARRSQVPLDASVALMDDIVPPSTAYAAYNAYAGPKELTVWPFNGHEGGGPEDALRIMHFFAKTLRGRDF
jgi:cephalosporin-C deacetylase